MVAQIRAPCSAIVQQGSADSSTREPAARAFAGPLQAESSDQSEAAEETPAVGTKIRKPLA